MHHRGTGAVRLLRVGLLRHAPPELAPMAATRLDLLSGYAQSRVLHPPAAAYYHFYYGYIGWYLPRYGHRHDLAALAAAPAAAGRYVAAAMYQGQPLQLAQPQGLPLQQPPPSPPQPLQQQAAAAAAALAAPGGPAAPTPLPQQMVSESEGGAAERAAGGSDGAGVGLDEGGIRAAVGQSLGIAGVDQGAASPSSSSLSSSSLVGSSTTATVASAATGEGPPPPTTAPGPAEQQRGQSSSAAGLVGPRQLAEPDSLVAGSIRGTDVAVGRARDD